jgi:hypothetical protein
MATSLFLEKPATAAAIQDDLFSLSPPPKLNHKRRKNHLTPIVPRDFVTAPFFAAARQTEPRVLIISDVKWVIGDEHPTKRNSSPALDMRHGRACFTLLSFRDRIQNGREIRFSMNEFCNRYAQSRGGRYSREILDLLFDLRETWVRRESADGTIERFTIIGDIKTLEKPLRRREVIRAYTEQGEFWLDRVSLSPEFFGLLQQWEKLARIRLDVLTAMTSPTAQSIYTFLPSRAVHHAKEDPFAIRLANLLDQISHPVPEHKSVRKKIFTQNRRSIIAQLDGKEILNGLLRVSLADTKDGCDYNLLAWVEKDIAPSPTPPVTKSKLLDAWLASGRSKKDFDSRLKHLPPLSDYACELLARAGVTIDGNERFFEMAAALIGNRFEPILSEAKGNALEGDPGYTPTGRIIYRLIESVRQIQ